MLLKSVLDIQYRSRELTRGNFQSCCKLIDNLNDRGLTNALELQMDANDFVTGGNFGWGCSA